MSCATTAPRPEVQFDLPDWPDGHSARGVESMWLFVSKVALLAFIAIGLLIIVATYIRRRRSGITGWRPPNSANTWRPWVAAAPSFPHPIGCTGTTKTTTNHHANEPHASAPHGESTRAPCRLRPVVYPTWRVHPTGPFGCTAARNSYEYAVHPCTCAAIVLRSAKGSVAS